jgi:DnaK suppressor protein
MYGMATKTERADHMPEYRSALLAERVRVIGQHKELEILVLPGSIAVEDQAPLLHDQFVALRQHRMDRRKLKLIDGALTRLARGQFGICEECEDSIPAKRLNIVPWAAYCVACQERLDGRDDADETLEMIA